MTIFYSPDATHLNFVQQSREHRVSVSERVYHLDRLLHVVNVSLVDDEKRQQVLHDVAYVTFLIPVTQDKTYNSLCDLRFFPKVKTRMLYYYFIMSLCCVRLYIYNVSVLRHLSLHLFLILNKLFYAAT